MNKIVALIAVAGLAGAASAFPVIGLEDFDGGAFNLSSSVVPALDGGPGDYFGVGSRNAWPQGFPSPGVPFGIGDDSVFGYSNGAPFADDNEGVYGENSDLDNNYFAIADSDEFGANQTATWTFNISGFTDLSMSLGMGGVSSDSFDGYALGAGMTLTAQIDGGATQVVFDARAIDPTLYLTRLMDDGGQSGGGRLLQTLGDNAVTKILADTGLAAADTFLDKTPAAGVGAGLLDNFFSDLNGTGSSLVLTLTADMPFEAMVFDDITIYGIPAPGTLALLGLGGLAIRRRR